VECIANGDLNVLVGLKQGEIATTPLAQVVARKKPLDMSLVELANVLAK
jgi:hypothetical protein